MSPITIADAIRLVQQHQRAGRLAEAERICRQVLTQEPEYPPALHLLGVLAGQIGQLNTAIDLIRRAIASFPGEPTYHSNLGKFLADQQRFEESVAACTQALRLNPQLIDVYYNLGIGLAGCGRYAEAVTAFRRYILERPNQAEAYNNLGTTLIKAGDPDEAITCFRQALLLRPDASSIHYNLGVARLNKFQFDLAGDSFREALRLTPDFGEAHNGLGNAFKDSGRIDEAVACYSGALRLRPNSPQIHSSLLNSLQLQPGCTPQALREEARRWNQKFADPLRTEHRPHANDRNPDRPLRIGYISPDFTDHCQSFFTIPLLSAHDRSQFHVTCYANMSRDGTFTQRIQGYAHQWRNISSLPDARVAELIREDQIDILVDLTMHMQGNRLLVMRKPAPVQVTWLAYPGTTGVEAIDYRLTDIHLDPPGEHDGDYAETSIRLPDTFWCYDPLTTEPAINAPPFQKNGYITFGCLNNFFKVNDVVLALWARVLMAVANSRLLLLAPEGSARQRTLDILNTHGIARECTEFVARRPRLSYLELYHQIDIGLDTLPYNGHTTSLDSFWMGVPVVTQVGNTVVGRAGLCQLMNLNLPELIAHTPEAFVQIATDLAHDSPRLTALRTGLRERMQKSPLMDAPHFARNIEAAYRQIWQTWCNHFV